MLSRYVLIGASALALTLPGAAAQAARNSAPPHSARPAAGDWRSTEALLTRLLAERERTLGKENPFTLVTAASLALVYKAEGRYTEAGQLYTRTLEASERTLGKDNTFTQETAKALALVAGMQHQLAGRQAVPKRNP